MDNNFDIDILQICRTCMKEIKDASFFYLDCTPAANIQVTIRQKLFSCFPELDLRIVSDPVICSKCLDNLLSVFEFKKNCLQSEVQINKYIQQVQPTGDLNLVEVVRFHQPDINNIDIDDLGIITDFKKENLVCDTDAFNAASECTESTKPKYLLELQKVEMEDVLFNTFDDFNINCSLSAVEGNLDIHNSNIVQNCLPEVIQHQGNYSNNLNASVYYQCYKCGHKAENKLKLISHLKRHARKNLIHRKAISKRLSGYNKKLFGYYRCCFCNYLTKYQCLFDFHNRIHLTKNYKQFFKHTDVHRNAFHATLKVNKINIKGNKRKGVKNCNSGNNKNNLKPNMRAHIVKKLFKCSICKYQCTCKVNLKRHLRLHTEAKTFSCYVCKYQCSRKSNLKSHMLIHTGEKPFSCSVCGYQCRQKISLKRHIQNHTGEKPFSCFICEHQFSQKEGLKQHILIHMDDKPFSCSICKYQCSYKSELKRHMLIHTGEKPFSCSICKYQCSQKSSLKRHMPIHTGEKPFSCSVCEYRCNDKANLKRHMPIHTGEKPFSCSVCEYRCNDKDNLKQHMPIHMGENPFSCSICDYQCNRKNYLKRHMQIHTGRKKPFSCYVCKYQCSQKWDLKRHMLIHMEEKPFSCSVCEYQCNQKCHLKRHMQIHTGGKQPFLCYVCKYQCNHKSDLKRHMLIHTGEKPFSCFVCGFQCSQKGSLKRHIQCVHQSS